MGHYYSLCSNEDRHKTNIGINSEKHCDTSQRKLRAAVLFCFSPLVCKGFNWLYIRLQVILNWIRTVSNVAHALVYDVKMWLLYHQPRTEGVIDCIIYYKGFILCEWNCLPFTLKCWLCYKYLFKQISEVEDVFKQLKTFYTVSSHRGGGGGFVTLA